MIEDTALSRRAFIKLAVAATVSVFVRSQLTGIEVLARGQQNLLPLQLAALLAHQDSAKIIGAEYLRQYPQEAHVQILLDRIASSPAVSDGGLFGAIDQNLHKLLDRMIREDFGDDRVVKLKGWILAMTEARLCALAALM